jgi:GNAT superfamily N-acetyltransferase
VTTRWSKVEAGADLWPNDMNVSIAAATEADVPAIALLRTLAADQLTRLYGYGHWSSPVSQKSVLRGIKTSRLLVAKLGTQIVATLRLQTKKPWAIDTRYFVPVGRPLYLIDMAVEPTLQRQGIGRSLLAGAEAVARAWPGDAIRLDAYEGPAGAAPFYAKCGYREVGRASYRGVRLVYFELLL